MEIHSISLVIGIIFVVVYSYERFNDPISNRSSTTAARYHLAALSYTIAYLCIFFILSNYPALIRPLIDSMGKDAAEQFDKLPPALVVALLLTGFLQKIPVLSQIDKRLRERLEYLAAIPFEVRRLSKQLRNAEFLVGDATQKEIYRRLRDENLACDDINFEDRNESYWLWNKASVLMYQLSRWEEGRKTSAYMAAKSAEYNGLKNRYYRLSEMAKSCANICCQSRRDAEQDPAIAELIKTFQEQCRGLITAQCEFISHGALKSLFTNQSRIAALRDMGFQLPDKDDDAGLTVNQMATLLVALFGGMLTVMILSGGSFGSDPKTLIIITLIATMNMVAVATAVYTKGMWAISLPDANGSRPVFYYLLIALAAVIVSIPVTLFFNTLINYLVPMSPELLQNRVMKLEELQVHGLTIMQQMEFQALQENGLIAALKLSWVDFVTSSYPWKLLIFATTLCLAFQLDTKQIGTTKYPSMRWLEGAMQSCVAVVSAYMTYKWLLAVDFAKWQHVPLYKVLIRSAIIGFMIGYLIPYWYKVSPKKLNEELQTEEDYVLSKSHAPAVQQV